ncbi:outer membrane lipoprotein carrier protein LolA [Pseudogulbenkiania sp. MAI-1]|uniref:outer membrane lipoprotein carrier protein LolA n=1 Tax=Pseudogulbenkiania sp. MAI-1 TaxID=990370 RepID=UPI0004B535F8|nr:outer membrane lipoprotein carrier protein LolA [Pseudogulbenkiania sp. MAI-1]
MNRKPFALLLTLLLALPAHAAELLDQVAQRLSANSVLHADFAQTRQMAALKKPLQLSGRMAFSREAGVVWQIAKPYSLTYAMTARGVTEILPDGSRRERAARDVPGIGSVDGLFRGLVSGDKALLQQHFVVAAQGSPQAWTLQLTPKAGPLQKAIRSAELAGGAQLERVTLQETGGDSTVIRFSGIDTARPLAADEQKLLGSR